jgi:uncharacterized cupredoxin-like copper-binding protein
MVELLFLACHATEDQFPIAVEHVRREGDTTYTMVKASNNSECQIHKIIFECTYFDKAGTAVQMEDGRVRQLAPGSTERTEVTARGANLHSVSCRVVTVLDKRPDR